MRQPKEEQRKGSGRKFNGKKCRGRCVLCQGKVFGWIFHSITFHGKELVLHWDCYIAYRDVIDEVDEAYE